ncbi:MAG: hypothetical protein WD627_05370 [Actinomycetota bacterium]
MSRTHVVVDDDVMEAIDSVVGQRGRSRFLEEAAREKLARMALEESLKATSGIVHAKRHGDWSDRQSTRNWVKGIRRPEGTPN